MLNINQTNNDKENIIWVDYAKFIGILLVVFCHVAQALHLTDDFWHMKQIYNYIYLFHMPLFFSISGFLYHQKSRSQNMNKILYGLLIPYIIYQFLYLPFTAGMYLIKGVPIITVLFKCFMGILMGDFYNTDFSICVCGPCWFLMTMIQLRFIFSFIKTSNKNLIFISVFSIILLKLLIINGIDLLFCLDNTLMAIPYFAIGVLVHNIAKNTESVSMNTYSRWGAVGILGLALILILKFNGTVQLNVYITKNLIHKSLILAYIAGLAGSYMIFLISKCFKYLPDFVNKISKNTIFIIFYHCIFTFIILCFKLHLKYNFFINILISILSSLLIIYFSYVIISMLEKYCPILIGKQKKSRMENI